MFKKPQKKSFRRKAANGDSEDEAEESTKHDETSHQVGSSGSSSPSVTPVAKPGGSTKSVVVETVGGASSGGPGFVSKLSFEDDSGESEEQSVTKVHWFACADFVLVGMVWITPPPPSYSKQCIIEETLHSKLDRCFFDFLIGSIIPAASALLKGFRCLVLIGQVDPNLVGTRAVLARETRCLIGAR